MLARGGFWGQASIYFSKGTWQYPVHAVFIWNLASWDVQGVYPESTTPEGSYKDAKVAGLIRRHNQGVRAQGLAAAQQGGDKVAYGR